MLNILHLQSLKYIEEYHEEPKGEQNCVNHYKCEVQEKYFGLDKTQQKEVCTNLDDRAHNEEKHSKAVMENWHALVEACLLMIMSAEGHKSDVNHNHRLDQLVNHQIEKPFPDCIRQFWVRFEAECEQANRNDEWCDE